MIRGLAIALALQLVLAAAALAQGLNLGWQGATAASACPTNAGALVDLVDPCDGSGFDMMVGSVRAPSGLTQVTGEECYVDVTTASPALPDFWHLEAGGCGDGKLLMEAVFTGFSTGTGATQCTNYWGTAASGGFRWAPGVGGANRARMTGVFARTQSSASHMTAGRQYYVFRASLTADHASACAGCTGATCFMFNRCILTQPVGMGDADLSNADIRNFVTWRGGDACYVSVTRPSWGRMKSLYR